MAGLADGSGIPLRVIHRMHAIPDLGETSCSGLVAKETATRDGDVYQLRILDYRANFNLQKHPLITVYRPLNGANAFVNISWINHWRRVGHAERETRPDRKGRSNRLAACVPWLRRRHEARSTRQARGLPY